MTIEGWLPTRLNVLLNCHWAKRGRLKKADQEIVAAHAFSQEITRASGRRRVSMVLTLGKGQKKGDPDSWQKSILDALCTCGLILDDSSTWVEWGGVEFQRGPKPATTILLEDL